MTTNVSDYISVSQKLVELGCQPPQRIALLPINFISASTIADFRQIVEVATVKKLFRSVNLPCDEVINKDQRPPYIQNNAFEWIAPIIFVSGSCYSQNPDCISVALGIISNYLTDFFKGRGANAAVKIDIIIEETKTTKCKKVSYEGDISGLQSLEKIVRELQDG